MSKAERKILKNFKPGFGRVARFADKNVFIFESFRLFSKIILNIHDKTSADDVIEGQIFVFIASKHFVFQEFPGMYMKGLDGSEELVSVDHLLASDGVNVFNQENGRQRSFFLGSLYENEISNMVLLLVESVRGFPVVDGFVLDFFIFGLLGFLFDGFEFFDGFE